MRQVTRTPRSDGRAERDEAVARVDRHAPSDWRQEARAVVSRLAREQPTVHPDDVWDLLTTHPPEPRALGAVMVWARNQGFIEATDETRESERPEAHRNPKRVWRSLVFTGTPETAASRAAEAFATPRSVPDPLPHTRAKAKRRTGSASSTGSGASEPHEPGSRYAAYLARKQRAANSAEGS